MKFTLNILLTAALFLLPFRSAAPASASPTIPTNYYDYTWLDDFTTDYLHPMWSWVNEDSTSWNMAIPPGCLRIVTQAGSVHGGSNDQKNILVSEGSAGDSQITTRVAIDLLSDNQFAGIHFFGDDDNYIQLSYIYAGEPMIGLVREIGGISNWILTSIPAASPIYLRLSRSGNVYSGYFSNDGLTWTYLNQWTADLKSPKVGVLAASGSGSSIATQACFDFFEVKGAFLYPTQVKMDNFEGTSLDSAWSWQNENPADWSLTANPGHLRILTDDGSPGAQNLLYRGVPFGDFAAGIHLYYQPAGDWQFAGIVFGQDGGASGMKFGRQYCVNALPICAGGNGIYFDYSENGNYKGNFPTVVESTDEAYLLIERAGTIYSGYYSPDQVTWQLIGRHNTNGVFQPNKIALTAAQDYQAQKPAADFDWFFISSNPFVSLPVVIR